MNYGTGKISLGDYDYEKPSLSLASVKISSAVTTPMERYDFPGRYKTVDAGQKAAQIRMEAIDAQREQVTLSGNTKGIRAGYTFKLADHNTASLNEEYLVVSSALTFFDRGWAQVKPINFEVSNTLTCQSKKIPFGSKQEFQSLACAVLKSPSNRQSRRRNLDRFARSSQNSIPLGSFGKQR